MQVAIISPTRIEVDGKDAGLPGDWLAADLSRLSAFNAAMITWHASHVVAVQTKDADVAAAKATLAAEKSALIEAHETEREKWSEDMAVLGTKPEAQAIRKAQERTKKLEQLAALQAELRIDDHADLEAADAPGAIP